MPPYMVALVNVTNVPAQTGFAEAVMEMVTGKLGSAVMQTVFEVAGLPVAQARFDVKEQVIQSPSAGV